MNLRYRTGDDVPTQECIMYGLQQLVLFVASAVVMPVVVSMTLGLEGEEVAETLQRTFILCGVMTFLQVKWGHRFPIQDGPAGLWSSLIITMATTMPVLGKALPQLRTDLEFGMMAAGAVIVIISVSGLIIPVSKIFTPIINGLLILLMVIQISASIMRGMFGITEDSVAISGKTLFISCFTMIVILVINFYGKGFLRTIAVFVGMVSGWVLAFILDETESISLQGIHILSLPRPFPWGTPTFDLGITVTCVLAAFVLLSMAFASISGMAEACQETSDNKKLKSTVGFHGLAAFLTGVFGSIPFMPYVSSIGVVQMTGVAARKPMYLASGAMLLLGFFKPIGMIFSTIPSSAGNGALIMIFALCVGQALKEFDKVTFENRENLIVGMSIIIGTGVMFLPTEVFYPLPSVAACLLSNGLIVGMLAAFLLEHVVLVKKK